MGRQHLYTLYTTVKGVFYVIYVPEPYTEPIYYRGGEAKSIKSDFQWTAISHLPPIWSWLAEKWSNLNLLGHAEMGAKILSVCCTQLSLISSSFPEVHGLQRFPVVQQCLWHCTLASWLLSWCQRWGKQLFGMNGETLDLNFFDRQKNTEENTISLQL